MDKKEFIRRISEIENNEVPASVLQEIMRDFNGEYIKSIENILNFLKKGDTRTDDIFYIFISKFKELSNLIYYYNNILKEKYHGGLEKYVSSICNICKSDNDIKDDKKILMETNIIVFVTLISELIDLNIANCIYRSDKINKNSIKESEKDSIIEDVRFVSLYIECLIRLYESFNTFFDSCKGLEFIKEDMIKNIIN